MPARGVVVHRSHADLLRVRLRAIALLDAGLETAVVALRLEVTVSAVRRWRCELRHQLQRDAARSLSVIHNSPRKVP